MTTIHEIDREEVMALLDGEVSGDRAATIRAHLDRCPECRTLLDELRLVSARLSTWQVGLPPDAIVLPTVRNATPSRSPRSHFAAHLTVSPWSVAAAAALLIGVAFVGKSLWQSAEGNAEAPMTGLQTAPVVRGELGANGTLKKAPAAPAPPTAADSLVATLPPGFQPRNADKAGSAAGQQLQPAQAEAKESRMIVRAVTLNLSTDKFDDMRAAIDRVAAAHQGRIASLSASGEPPTHRSLNATVLVPVAETDAAVSGLRALGTVVQESQSSEDVTDNHRDLAIRLANAKVEEGRLGELLARGADKLSDVLAVEQAQSRVRGEIEQMTAEEQAMAGRAALSTITVQVEERYRAEITLGPVTLSTRFHNALVDGLRGAVDTIIDVSLALVGAAPAIGLWGLLLFWPTRWAWRRIRQ
jgi:hypothetical protein